MQFHRTEHQVNVPFLVTPSYPSQKKLKVQGDQEFKRIEDKYLIPLELSIPILEEVFNHMEPSYLSADTRFNLIESLYFDSKELDFFQHHFLNIPTRYKLRIRKYAPNGVWADEPLLLEIKKKKEGETKKTRFMILNSHLEQLKRGETIQFSSELRDLNKDMKKKKIMARIEKVNNLFQKYSLTPTLSVQYHRLAFEKGNLRVTLDRELIGENQYSFPLELSQKFKSMSWWNETENLLHKFVSQSHCILEIKHQNNIPSWLQDVLEKHQIQKTSFSKYCWFVGKNLNFN